jgi:hypothetical protein
MPQKHLRDADEMRQEVPAPSERTYYQLDVNMGLSSSPWHVWLNEERLMKGFRPEPRKPFHGLIFSELPQISFDRKERPGPLRDAETIMLGIWLVSDRVKALFEHIDPKGFAFVQAEVDYSNFEEPGPGFWFCDIVRQLDCVDEQTSKIIYQEDISWTNYIRLIDVKMLPNAIGAAHAFRLKKQSLIQIVDDVTADAIKREDIKGFRFVTIQQPFARKNIDLEKSAAQTGATSLTPTQDAAKRRYHRIDVHRDTGSGAPEAIWRNKAKLQNDFRWDGAKPFGGMFFSELPKVAFERWKRNGPLNDAYPMMLDFWLVSERTKTLFGRLDPEAFAFARAEMDYSNFDKPGPAFWLCHIVRQLDCVNEETSFINYHKPTRQYLSLIKAQMRPEIIGSAHAFFLKRSVSLKIVDDIIVHSIKAANITGFRIAEIQEP